MKINNICSLCNSEASLKDLRTEDFGAFQLNICNSCGIINTVDIPDNNKSIANFAAGKVELVSDDIKIITANDQWGSENLSKAAENIGLNHKPEDLLFIEHKFVHANTNKNKDHFEKEELMAAEKTPILKPLNWEHREPHIGVIFGSEYIKTSEDSDEPDYLLVAVAVWKYKHPEKAQEIIERHENGNLLFSMEAYFDKAQCSKCDKVFEGGEETYCSHLQSRYSAGSTTRRILRVLNFAGDAVVKHPADSKAESLALASDKDKDENENKSQSDNQLKNSNGNNNLKEENKLADNKTYTDKEFNDKLEERIEAYKSEINLEKLEATNEQLKKDLEDAKAEVETLNASIEELTGEKNSLAEKNTEIEGNLEVKTKEFDEFKTAVEAKEILRKRISELETIGYENVPGEDDEENYKTFANKLMGMDDDAFDFMKEFIEGNKEKVNADEKEEEPDPDTDPEDKNETTASEEDGGGIPLTGNDDGEPMDKYTKMKMALAGVLNPSKLQDEDEEENEDGNE